MTKTIMIVCLSLLAGCAPASLQGLRENKDHTDNFIVERNYQAVYKDIKTKAQECYQGGFLGIQATNVDGDLYTELNEGNIYVAMTDLPGRTRYWLSVDLKKVEQQKTNVSVYCAFSTWKHAFVSVKKWANGDTSACR